MSTGQGFSRQMTTAEMAARYRAQHWGTELAIPEQ